MKRRKATVKSPPMAPKTTKPVKTPSPKKSRKKAICGASGGMGITAWVEWAGVPRNSRRAAKVHLSDMGIKGPVYPADELAAAKVRELLSLGDKGGRPSGEDPREDMASLKYRKLKAETHKVEQALTSARSDLLRRYRNEVLLPDIAAEFAPIVAECRRWIPANQRRPFNKLVEKCDAALAKALELHVAEWLRGLEVE